MPNRYRYSTRAVHGRWFTSAHMACADAIRAGQAYRDEDGTIVWRGDAGLEANPLKDKPRACEIPPSG